MGSAWHTFCTFLNFRSSNSPFMNRYTARLHLNVKSVDWLLALPACGKYAVDRGVCGSQSVDAFNGPSELFDKNSCSCLMYTSAGSGVLSAFLLDFALFAPNTLHICENQAKHLELLVKVLYTKYSLVSNLTRMSFRPLSCG